MRPEEESTVQSLTAEPWAIGQPKPSAGHLAIVRANQETLLSSCDDDTNAKALFLNETKMSVANKERGRQLTLGMSFLSAAIWVLTLLTLRLGHCCSWFGSH
jgi:hypothetical protein